MLVAEVVPRIAILRRKSEGKNTLYKTWAPCGAHVAVIEPVPGVPSASRRAVAAGPAARHPSAGLPWRNHAPAGPDAPVQWRQRRGIVLRDGWALDHGAVQQARFSVGERIIRPAGVVMGQGRLGDVQINVRRRILGQRSAHPAAWRRGGGHAGGGAAGGGVAGMLAGPVGGVGGTGWAQAAPAPRIRAAEASQMERMGAFSLVRVGAHVCRVACHL